MDFVAALMCIKFSFNAADPPPPRLSVWGILLKKALSTEINENLPAFLLKLFYDIILKF